MTVEVGQPAPDFELKNQHGELVKLSDFRGSKNVVLLFYPFAFTGTCTGELCAVRDDRADFVNDQTQILAISCDTPHSLRIFAAQEGFDYPLLSDFWPHGEVARQYGVFREDRGAATRGTFVIDRDGIVRWSVVNAMGDARSNDDYRKALANLA
ncbi:MAG: peroxiredoxin [Actinomycetota bacterium]|nr:MAG: peroxiredoxin [Actinomycetota bacterium]